MKEYELKTKIYQLYEEKLDVLDIANEIDRHPNYVLNILEDYAQNKPNLQNKPNDLFKKTKSLESINNEIVFKYNLKLKALFHKKAVIHILKILNEIIKNSAKYNLFLEEIENGNLYYNSFLRVKYKLLDLNIIRYDIDNYGNKLIVNTEISKEIWYNIREIQKNFKTNNLNWISAILKNKGFWATMDILYKKHNFKINYSDFIENLEKNGYYVNLFYRIKNKLLENKIINFYLNSKNEKVLNLTKSGKLFCDKIKEISLLLNKKNI